MFVVRAVAVLSMSFAAAFGFLAAMRNPAANYNPYLFAVGSAALFGLWYETKLVSAAPTLGSSM